MTLSPRIQTGKIRHRIQILQANGVQDSTGGFSLANNNVFATVWASVEAIDGSEALAAGAETSVVRYRMEIRYLPGVTAAMQVLLNGAKHQIESVQNPDGRTKKLYLHTVEINDSQQQ